MVEDDNDDVVAVAPGSDNFDERSITRQYKDDDEEGGGNDGRREGIDVEGRFVASCDEGGSREEGSHWHWHLLHFEQIAHFFTLHLHFFGHMQHFLQ